MNKLKQLISSPTGLLTISQFISLGFAFITSIIIANSLGLEKFGIYTFYFSITSIFLLFFRFGYFSSIGVLLVKNHNKQREKELLGAGLILSIFIGLLYSLFLYFIVDIINNMFETNIKDFILITLPFLVLMPFTMYLTQVAQSLNKFKPLILFTIISSFLSFSLVLYLYISKQINIEWLIVSKVIPMTLLALITVLMYKLSFRNLFRNLFIINIKNKKHGFHLYLGQITDQFVYKSDELMISYFIGNSELGLYKIAQQLTSPFKIFANSYALSKYRIIANNNVISVSFQKLLLKIAIVSFLLSILFSIFSILIFYSNEFKFAIYIAIILSLAMFFNSLYLLYNNYLNAHSFGKITRNNSIKTGIINLIGNVILIPIVGAMGAAVSSAFAMISFFIFSKMEYLRRSK